MTEWIEGKWDGRSFVEPDCPTDDLWFITNCPPGRNYPRATTIGHIDFAVKTLRLAAERNGFTGTLRWWWLPLDAPETLPAELCDNLTPGGQ